ncbi:DUF4136 domain-containing protein [Rhodoferax saidenbachensis]|uniref:DUF4136 domain-containing protein n=1 Tax=Rhodoferax saidenbachensis TaxID=1484693 RepID=A0ABU1ZTH6_9BURK|nr:DUF4136 domain-containing protein [Rhodoferax saidenbachensis]MDR7308140.1 hypothetical protein [Rhodoferax saidenbachensis]
MPMLVALRRWGLTLVALLLVGCATSRMIDSDVQSFVGTTPVVSGASYRFERLPSQAANGVQNRIEAMTEQALANAGLHRSDTAPRYLVQVSVGVEGMQNPYARPPRFGLVLGTNGLWYERALLDMDPPWVRHRVHLLLRDTANGQVAYETSAVFESPWSDTLNLLPPMLEAALQNYPQPGAHKVVVELPAPGKDTR